MKKTIKIGNAGGFWGDDLKAFKRQLTGGELDYLTVDYLAEITMSILKKQQLKNPKLGYVTDFVEQIDEVAEILAEKSTRIVVNAGGINPLECARQITNRLKAKNISLKIAVIEGDNIVDKVNEFYPEKASFKNLEDGSDFSIIKDKVQSANVYLGVQPILKALETGAQIVIAGRVTDTSITMAPMIHEFGWKLDDWDKLATGIVAAHIIECGAQSAGGNFTDWHKVEKWDNFGYPIVEVSDDATFVVTKHENTGGLISIDTLREQIVYEMGDPAEYISPDVIADFRTINLEANGKDRVKVFGIKGRPSTKTYKVSMAYADGFKATGSIIISAPDAMAKAEKFAEIFWSRFDFDFEKKNAEFVGYNACHQSMSMNNEANEVLLKFSVFDFDKNKVEEFAKSLAPLILSGPAGVAVTGGRPRVTSVMTYWPALLPKDLISTTVRTINEHGEVDEIFEISEVTGNEQDPVKPQPMKSNLKSVEFSQETKTVRFIDICLARSGDKGDSANVGVIARSPEVYEFIKSYLTTEKMAEMFASFCNGEVKRYELDNLHALNFMLGASLDGGGTKSLMIDAQGKTFASALLNQKIDVPLNVLESLKLENGGL